MRYINSILFIILFLLNSSCIFKNSVLTTPVSGDRVAYIDHTSHRDYICSIDLQGKNKRILYRSSPDKPLRNLSASPDGHLIAFQEGNEKYLVGIDAPPDFRTYRLKILNSITNEIHDVASSTMIELHPCAWAPNGQVIAYDNEDSMQQNDFLYTYDLKTRKSSLFKENTSWKDYITWSPGGELIAIVSVWGDGIRIYNTVSSEEVKWINPFPYNDSILFNTSIVWVSWLTDDTLLYFTSDDILIKESISSGNKDIYGQPFSITFLSSMILSPDSKYFLTAGQMRSESQHGYYIFRINIEDGKVERLTNLGNDLYPAWAPDGRSIVFASKPGHRAGIYILDLNTRQSRKLIQGKHLSCPVWLSP